MDDPSIHPSIRPSVVRRAEIRAQPGVRPRAARGGHVRRRRPGRLLRQQRPQQEHARVPRSGRPAVGASPAERSNLYTHSYIFPVDPTLRACTLSAHLEEGRLVSLVSHNCLFPGRIVRLHRASSPRPCPEQDQQAWQRCTP
eukprot:scaffold979_cov382-Prasinococcus_capsulatus_cf.AAC.5